MLEFKAVLRKLNNSEKFKTYLKKNPDAYLTNALFLKNWQLNFFSPSKQLITIFNININNKITTQTSREERTFPKLDTALKLDSKEALKILESQISKFYSSETFTKTIIILHQNSEPVWNITKLSSSLKILNLKISALSGKILQESYNRLIDIK